MASSIDFDDFFRREFGHLVAFLVKMNFDRATSEDAAVDAMVAARSSWATLTCASAWVRKAAYRIALKSSLRNREGVRRAISGGWLNAPNDHSVDDTLAAIVEQPQVEYLLAKLPERQRLVLAWHLDGFTNVEIAEALEMTSTTVRSTLRHAKDRLKKEFEGTAGSESVEGGGAA
ncbi:sigma-70 family RNA polymerase sigma factor [Lentzea sp. BCCO 10_0798]|uniref:Sigma-70 family RNA polymerase sigma factor n=1 Tax=Lentzea kristufekii TaxID=3095430 RepID=A0ABU4TYW1_9PSEU|nr:sigma-70 family RNA polymerase sigma factor [Lentzea sp. BCCO 10_0798]MDX8052981.1 sigma-70 family RNA polymerase sigma factor [Lentzea sp. BCCO 10_0798]